MNRVGREVISIAGAQPVGFVADAQLQSTADDPVRLIFGVRVRAILRAGRVAPLKDAVTFAPQTLLKFFRIRERRFTPALDLNGHKVGTISVRRWVHYSRQLIRGPIAYAMVLTSHLSAASDDESDFSAGR